LCALPQAKNQQNGENGEVEEEECHEKPSKFAALLRVLTASTLQFAAHVFVVRRCFVA